jgi:hypothetical protein
MHYIFIIMDSKIIFSDKNLLAPENETIINDDMKVKLLKAPSMKLKAISIIKKFSLDNYPTLSDDDIFESETANNTEDLNISINGATSSNAENINEISPLYVNKTRSKASNSSLANYYESVAYQIKGIDYTNEESAKVSTKKNSADVYFEEASYFDDSDSDGELFGPEAKYIKIHGSVNDLEEVDEENY